MIFGFIFVVFLLMFLGFVARWVAKDVRRHAPDIPPWIVVIGVLFTFPLGLWAWLFLRSLLFKGGPAGGEASNPAPLRPGGAGGWRRP